MVAPIEKAAVWNSAIEHAARAAEDVRGGHEWRASGGSDVIAAAIRALKVIAWDRSEAAPGTDVIVLERGDEPSGPKLYSGNGPEISADLIARCKEILKWQDTGVLSGDALRRFAAARPYANYSGALTVAQNETATEAMRCLVDVKENK